MKNLVFDIDGTLCPIDPDVPYDELPVFEDMIVLLRGYREQGWRIVLHTSRQMRTYGNSVGEINAKMLPVLLSWLDLHQVPYDEIHIGKPWCGHEGFYIDDKAVRPSEFRSKTIEQLQALIAAEIR